MRGPERLWGSWERGCGRGPRGGGGFVREGSVGFILVAVSLVLSPNLYPKRRKRPLGDERVVPSGTLLLGRREGAPDLTVPHE